MLKNEIEKILRNLVKDCEFLNVNDSMGEEAAISQATSAILESVDKCVPKEVNCEPFNYDENKCCICFNQAIAQMKARIK